MKKISKLFCLLMVLVMGLTMFTGCITTSDDTESVEDAKTITMTIGIPLTPSDPDWSKWEPQLMTWIEDMAMFMKVDLKLAVVPTEEKELKEFMKKVDSGKIAMFFSSREDFIEELIEEDSLMDLISMQSQYEAILEETGDALINISREDSSYNYMVPVYGTYQGLYYNRTLFKSLELENPNTWENLLAAVEKLKEEGITPIAAGFQDEGLEYMMDEMILSEGGVGEHSYTPTLGVIASWERALTSLKDLEKAGAFTADCYNVSFEDAVASFLDGSAAMIVAPSTAFGGELPQEDVKVIGFPATPTGRRDEGAFIGRYTHGFYVSAAFWRKSLRHSESVVELLTQGYIDADEFYQIFEDESTMNINAAYYDYNHEDVHLMNSVGALLKGAADADWPMRQRLYTYDNILKTFREILNGADMSILQEATDQEIAAREAAEAEEEDKK